MKQLIIPNYEAEIPGEVYSTDMVSSYPNGNRLILKNILTVNRYTEPCNARIIVMIKECAEKTLSQRKPIENRSQLENIMCTLTNTDLRSITRGNSLMNKIVQALPQEYYVSEKDLHNYLLIQNGLIPKETYDLNKKNGMTDNINWYSTAFNDETLKDMHLGFQWSVRFTLKKGRLPRRKEIDEMRKHEVVESNIFWIEGGPYADDVTAIIATTYKVFSKSSNMILVADNGEKYNESIAVETLASLLTVRIPPKPEKTAQLPVYAQFEGKTIN